MKRVLLLVAVLAPSLAAADGKQVASADGKQVAAADDKRVTESDAAVPGTTAMCIDQEIADRLAIKRKRRGAVDRLFVKEAFVGKTLVMKRFRPRARGRVGRIQKPFSNITVGVKEREETE